MIGAGIGAESEAAPLPARTTGASVPFTTYEAENATHTGTSTGPDHTQGSLPSEASGRRAVRLTSGQYVEFTLSAPANAVDVRYSIPDGRDGTLSVYVGGEKLPQRLNLTSRFSYVDTPWITGSRTHHFYDDDRMLLGRDVATGTRVRLQVDSGDNAGEYTIDLADFEQVAPPAVRPGGSVSVTDHGAVPNDSGDDANAFRQAIAAARGQGATVWIPSGEFYISSALQVDQVTIRGGRTTRSTTAGCPATSGCTTSRSSARSPSGTTTRRTTVTTARSGRARSCPGCGSRTRSAGCG
jgi:hypothetical protein